MYKRGLREPHVSMLPPAAQWTPEMIESYAELEGMAYLQVITPIDKKIVQDVRAGFDFRAWPNLAARITDACRSYDPANGKISEPEETQDRDEPQALWARVAIPIPTSLLSDTGYDIGQEILSEVEEGAAMLLRRFQTRLFAGVEEPERA
jgi:hypothetical protein